MVSDRETGYSTGTPVVRAGNTKCDSPAAGKPPGPPTSVGEHPRTGRRPRHLRSARPSRRLKSAVPGNGLPTRVTDTGAIFGTAACPAGSPWVPIRVKCRAVRLRAVPTGRRGGGSTEALRGATPCTSTAPGAVCDVLGWDRPRQTRRWSEPARFNVLNRKQGTAVRKIVDSPCAPSLRERNSEPEPMCRGEP